MRHYILKARAPFGDGESVSENALWSFGVRQLKGRYSSFNCIGVYMYDGEQRVFWHRADDKKGIN